MTVETLLILQSTPISFASFMHSSSRFWKAIMSFCTGFTYFSVNEFNNILQTKYVFHIYNQILSPSQRHWQKLFLCNITTATNNVSFYISFTHTEKYTKNCYTLTYTHRLRFLCNAGRRNPPIRNTSLSQTIWKIR